MPRPSLVLLLAQCYAEQVGQPHQFGVADLISEMREDDGLATGAHDEFDRLAASPGIMKRDFVSASHFNALQAATNAVPRPPPPQDAKP